MVQVYTGWRNSRAKQLERGEQASDEKAGPPANAVVHKDIPDNAIVALVPGYQILSYAGNRRRPSSV